MRKWHVYELRDQRDDQPFYIGMTGNMASTMSRHWGGGISAASDRCKELKALGYQLDLRVLSIFDSRDDALAEEGRLIQSLPGLVNRTHKPKREPDGRRYVILLTEDERSKLEAARQLLGLRSEADVIRHWIKTYEPRARYEAAKADLKDYMAAGTAAAQRLTGATVQIGPVERKPGSMLKKEKK